jgi:hypothetical protein
VSHLFPASPCQAKVHNRPLTSVHDLFKALDTSSSPVRHPSACSLLETSSTRSATLGRSHSSLSSIHRLCQSRLFVYSSYLSCSIQSPTPHRHRSRRHHYSSMAWSCPGYLYDALRHQRLHRRRGRRRRAKRRGGTMEASPTLVAFRLAGTWD